MSKKPLIEIHKDFILFLTSLSPQQRKKLISILKKKQIDSISEIFANFLKSNLTQNAKIIQKLKKYRREIQSVARKRTPIQQKRQILNSKRGGFILSALLPIATSVISSLLTK